MLSIKKCQEKLVHLAEKQGYLTFDDILTASDTFSLSVSEVDMLSEAIQLLGIIVYETAPKKQLDQQHDDFSTDSNRIDYDAIFSEVLTIEPRLESLIREIKTQPKPQWGEVNRLFMQMTSGNQFARERIIKLYLRNVIRIALPMAKLYELNLEDAVSAGFLGLINAVEKFDPNGFSAFSSYIAFFIRNSIFRECNPSWMICYYPSHYKDRLLRCYLKYNQYTVGEEKNSNEYYNLIKRISRELDISEIEVDLAIKRVFAEKEGSVCIDDLTEQAFEDEITLPCELVLDETDLFDNITSKELIKIADTLLSSLKKKEAKVIRMRNGIGLDRPRTLEEIGSTMNVTRERIRQIEAKTMRKLRDPRITKGLEELL